jgi:MinD superfamily P-loop ATPase
MIVAIASGKGGTGKTTVAASLAYVWDRPVQAVDLDVEEPNLHLFLRPDIAGQETADMFVPVPNQDLCNACRACAEICQFKAITVLGEYVMAFPEMCHGCEGCLMVCPTGAITEGSRELGEILWGSAGDIRFLMGRLRIGEAMSPPLMHHVLKHRDHDRDTIIDAPPGTSCPAINAVLKADIIVLVSEPTPFGFHDLKLAREAFQPLNKPMGVVVNRAGLGDDSLYTYCRATGLPILMEIPFDRDIARAYSEGLVIAESVDTYRVKFEVLRDRIRMLRDGVGPEVAYA